MSEYTYLTDGDTYVILLDDVQLDPQGLCEQLNQEDLGALAPISIATVAKVFGEGPLVEEWDWKFVGCQSVFRIRSGGQAVPTAQSVTMRDGLNLREVGLDARTMITAVEGYLDE